MPAPKNNQKQNAISALQLDATTSMPRFLVALDFHLETLGLGHRVELVRCLKRHIEDQGRFLSPFWAIRAFTNFLIRADGSGLSTGKRIVPLAVS